MTDPNFVVWTDDLHRRLAELHANDDLTFRDIAARLSREFNVTLSKNACIGKARRMGLKIRPQVNPPKPQRKPPKPPRVTPEVVPVVLPRWEVELPPAPQGKLTIYQLDGSTCHYPFGERPPYSYCGEPTALNSAWCEGHFRTVYAKWR